MLPFSTFFIKYPFREHREGVLRQYSGKKTKAIGGDVSLRQCFDHILIETGDSSEAP